MEEKVNKWGGKRPGAGRKPTLKEPASNQKRGEKRKPHSLYCDDYEFSLCKKLLSVVRFFR